MFDDLLDDDSDTPPDQGGCVIGIDLGTTNSVVAAVVDGRPVVLRDAAGNNLQPSVVSWTPAGERLVGAEARKRRLVDPANTVHSAKRIIGQSFRAPRVQEAVAQLPYRVVEGPSEEPLVVTRAGQHTVPDISGWVLSHLKRVAEAQLGRPVTHCVVTVPANFSDGQRAATRRAAEAAGMEVLRILNEPTAAALAYGQDRTIHQRLAVFDLGGGTFDISLLAVRDNIYEVIATGGDPFLGGDDIDRVLAERLADDFLREHRVDLRADPSSRAKLRAAAEQIKHRLSSDLAVEGQLAELAHGPGGKPLGLRFRLERAELEALIRPIVDRAIDKVAEVLADAGVSPERVDEVILVGGSTRAPYIQRRVAEQFGRRPRIDIDPMEAVALGAALQAQNMFAPVGRPGVLLDVIPHSLGIATVGGFTQTIIPKNTQIPAEGRKTFLTARDNQGSVTLRVCQGEAQRFDENTPVGELNLDELPAGRRGDIKLEVAFLIDADGILQIAAKELSTGRDARATLTTIGLGGTR